MKRFVLPLVVSLMGFCGSAHAAPQVQGCNIAKPGPSWVAVRIQIHALGMGGPCPSHVPHITYQDLNPVYYAPSETIAVCKKADVDTSSWMYTGEAASGWGNPLGGPCMYKNTFNQPVHGTIFYFQRI